MEVKDQLIIHCHTMAVDGLATPGARASAAMVVTKISRIILTSASKGLMTLSCLQLVRTEQDTRQKFERDMRQVAEERMESMTKMHADELSAMRDAQRVSEKLGQSCVSVFSVKGVVWVSYWY